MTRPILVVLLMIPSFLAVALLSKHPTTPLLVKLAPGINNASPRRNNPTWIRARREVSAGTVALNARLAALTHQDLERRVISKGPSRLPTITLTFDDGPHPACTRQLLQALHKLQVPATFFVVGYMAEKNPDLVRAIHSCGFEIGSHTFSHANLTLLSQEDVLTEFRAANDVIKRITGTTPLFCRPPGGDLSLPVLRSAADLGLYTVMWTDDPGDYDSPSNSIVIRKALHRLSPGGIILMHDCPRAVETVPMIVTKARAMGYRFVPLSQYLPRG